MIYVAWGIMRSILILVIYTVDNECLNHISVRKSTICLMPVAPVMTSLSMALLLLGPLIMVTFDGLLP